MKKAKSIKEVVETALSGTNKSTQCIIGKVPANQGKLIESFIGIKMHGVERILDSSAVLHTLRKHGDAVKEARRGQIAVTTDDFNRVPYILKEPDIIEYKGKNKRRQDVFLYYKKMEMLYIVCECVRVASSGNKMVFTTLYKRKKPPTMERLKKRF